MRTKGPNPQSLMQFFGLFAKIKVESCHFRPIFISVLVQTISVQIVLS